MQTVHESELFNKKCAHMLKGASSSVVWLCDTHRNLF